MQTHTLHAGHTIATALRCQMFAESRACCNSADNEQAQQGCKHTNTFGVLHALHLSNSDSRRPSSPAEANAQPSQQRPPLTRHAERDGPEAACGLVQVHPVALKQQVHGGARDVVGRVPEVQVHIWRGRAGRGRDTEGRANSRLSAGSITALCWSTTAGARHKDSNIDMHTFRQQVVGQAARRSHTTP